MFKAVGDKITGPRKILFSFVLVLVLISFSISFVKNASAGIDPRNARDGFEDPPNMKFHDFTVITNGHDEFDVKDYTKPSPEDLPTGDTDLTDDNDLLGNHGNEASPEEAEGQVTSPIDSSADTEGTTAQHDAEGELEEVFFEGSFSEPEENIEIMPSDAEQHIVYKVELKPKEVVNFVRFEESVLFGKPSQIQTPIEGDEGKGVVVYLDLKLFIDEEYIQESDIESLTFYYKIKKETLDKLRIEKASLVLIRYNDNEWKTPIENIYLYEDDEYIYYSADHEGCSTFAIVGSRVVEKGEAFKTNEPDVPWLFIFLFGLIGTVILIVVLFKARFVYAKDDEENNEETNPSLAAINSYFPVEIED
jgi:PGF-pre-PGF domain-containing protein